MPTGFHIQLLLFTALSPAGAVAFILVAMRILSAPRDAPWLFRLQRSLLIPIALCMLGLVIAATHLGTPRNALYVLLGVGRSPLSNEMAAILAFLSLAWLFWLSLATRRLPLNVGKAWLSITCVAACVMIYAVSVAYSIPTVPVWNLPISPALCWFSALVLGAPLALLTLNVARAPLPRPAARAIVGIQILGAMAELGAMALLHRSLAPVSSALVNADALVPHFWWFVSAFAILSGLSIALALRAQAPRISEQPRTARRRLAAATALAAGAVVCVRVPFYVLSLTVGV
ncbi:dimethyl sulfoxide reductase anchor subunit family protein [Adlercreutzia mucosicola]|uniref:dimethyl sulfoxide reductase anchor subunit family protein n=1 Tax=Adlercreutzia mucosicola TaxID=580026 RepID=UPI0004255DBC|nr:DmsC/YnfH family molybdoenzyme membrane anchor subunit [Adlercreutzia mucosicola]MCR2034869.1 dimethyl sulfoxide reductase anchor subunit [Adlercreutzia mucosicola]